MLLTQRRWAAVVWAPFITVLLTCPLLASRSINAGDPLTLNYSATPVLSAARPLILLGSSLQTAKLRIAPKWTSPGVALAAATPETISDCTLVYRAHQQSPLTPPRSACRLSPFPTGPPLDI